MKAMTREELLKLVNKYKSVTLEVKGVCASRKRSLRIGKRIKYTLTGSGKPLPYSFSCYESDGWGELKKPGGVKNSIARMFEYDREWKLRIVNIRKGKKVLWSRYGKK